MKRKNGVPLPDDEPDALDRWRANLPIPTRAGMPARLAIAQLRTERPRTVHETAEELGLSVHTVRAWIAERRIAHLRLGRAIRVPASEIRRMIEKSTVPAVSEG